jgi:hypothetical protein
MINALTFQNKYLLNRYLQINTIKGFFIAKNWNEKGNVYYEVFEGKPDYCGFLAGGFPTKREALQLIKELCNHTGLPRFKNFNC